MRGKGFKATVEIRASEGDIPNNLLNANEKASEEP